MEMYNENYIMKTTADAMKEYIVDQGLYTKEQLDVFLDVFVTEKHKNNELKIYCENVSGLSSVYEILTGSPRLDKLKQLAVDLAQYVCGRVGYCADLTYKAKVGADQMIVDVINCDEEELEEITFEQYI